MMMDSAVLPATKLSVLLHQDVSQSDAAGVKMNRPTVQITQAFTFEAAHRLPNVPNTHRCHRMHGHSYRVELKLRGAVDPVSGFVVDFFDIETVFSPLLVQLDHHCLNDIEGLENPTAENIAVWIWDRVKTWLPQLSAVAVYETGNSWAEYSGG
jgi:6-pyruvoyltetrahydropterin/6-carboxytetrahydropterin synthase